MVWGMIMRPKTRLFRCNFIALNSRGFSLLEALVVLGIVSVVTYGVADLIRFTAASLARVERKADLQDAKRELEQILSPDRKITATDSLCHCMLTPGKSPAPVGHLTFSGLGTASDTNPVVKNLGKLYATCGATAPVILDTSAGPQKWGKLKFKSVKFETLDPVTNATVPTSVRGRWIFDIEPLPGSNSEEKIKISQVINLAPKAGSTTGEMEVNNCISANPAGGGGGGIPLTVRLPVVASGTYNIPANAVPGSTISLKIVGGSGGAGGSNGAGGPGMCPEKGAPAGGGGGGATCVTFKGTPYSANGGTGGRGADDGGPGSSCTPHGPGDPGQVSNVVIGNVNPNETLTYKIGGGGGGGQGGRAPGGGNDNGSAGGGGYGGGGGGGTGGGPDGWSSDNGAPGGTGGAGGTQCGNPGGNGAPGENYTPTYYGSSGSGSLDGQGASAAGATGYVELTYMAKP